jgi:hypothetical protein
LNNWQVGRLLAPENPGELPRTTVISIGHRPELEAFHQRKLTIARRPDGATIVSDRPIPQSAAPNTLRSGSSGENSTLARLRMKPAV